MKIKLDYLKFGFIILFLVSLWALNSVYHAYRVYDLFFINILHIPWNFNSFTETIIILSLYSVIFIFGYILLFTKIGRKISDRNIFTYAIILLLIIITIFATFLGNNAIIDFNSDNDEALEIWISNFFSFNFPYNGTTQLGNLISPLPFLPLYSIPFYMIGNVGYQNIINIFIIIFVLFELSNNRKELNFGLISLIISIPFYIFLLAQSDHITVAVFTALGIYLLYKKKFMIGSVIFGLLMTSKGYIWLIIPTTLYYIYLNANRNIFKKSISIYALISSILILPFILWDPTFFFNVAPIGVESAHLYFFKYSDIIISITVILISLYSLKKVKNIFLSLFLTYLTFSIFLFSRAMFLLSLSVVMLGIYMNSLRQEKIQKKKFRALVEINI